MEGIFIPMEFYKIKELNGLERDVLALYKYYTENGTNRCCSLSSVQIAEMFNVSSRYIKMVRKHLNDLGYIRTDGGIKVTYIGVQKGSTVPPKEDTKGEAQFTPKGTTVHPGVKHSSPQKGSTVPPKGEVQFTHKKEKKEKKEIKKEEKREMTNLDQLLNRLPADYKTPEIVEFIKKNLMKEINQADFSVSGALDSCVVGLKTVLSQEFDIYLVPDKPAPVKKTDDDDFMW